MPIRVFDQNNREWFETNFCGTYIFHGSFEHFHDWDFNRKGSAKAKQHNVYRRHHWEPERKNSASHLQVWSCETLEEFQYWDLNNIGSKRKAKQSCASRRLPSEQQWMNWNWVLQSIFYRRFKHFHDWDLNKIGSTTKAKQHIVYRRHHWQPQRKNSASHLQV